jgi:uncharacterized membrane protein YphA (DoxX/SURF4 family)
MLYQSLSSRVYDVNMKDIVRTADDFLKNHPAFVPLFLRIGLATVFVYAAVSSTVSPGDWVGYLPGILTAAIPAELLLKFFSVYEVILAVWLLSGVHVRYAGLLAAVTLAGIVLSNITLFAISFRDIGLMFAALALAFSEERKPVVQ